ncbi:MAG: ribose-phosphate diphosphokinase [Methanobacteriota archaeon]
MYIIPGPASLTTAQDVAKLLHQPLAKTTVKRFADNEAYVRIEDNIRNEDVIIIQTTYPDPHIVELLLLQDAASEAKAKTITVIAPYYGYSRQDKKFLEGEAISARALAEHISLHADQFITVDPHKERILDFFSIPAKSCSAVQVLADYMKKKKVDFVLAPDKGALTRAQQVSQYIGCDFDYMEKTRIDSQTVHIKTKNLDVQKKKVIIIDDIISTGGTMVQSVKELKKQGAKEVSVACTHGLFIGDAHQRLTAAGCDDIISTDTIQNNFSKVHIASCITEILNEF